MARRVLTHNLSLLHVDHVVLNKDWNYKNVISPYIRIYYIDEGEGCITTVNEKIKLQPGYIYIVPNFTLCSLECNNSLSQYFIHLFEDSPFGLSLFQHHQEPIGIKALDFVITAVKRLLEINPQRKLYRSDNPKVYEKNILYKEYQELNNQQSESVFMETQGILLQLISQFLPYANGKILNKTETPSIILDAIRFIQINLSSEITVSQLARRANLQIDYFSRVFLRYTGDRPLGYVQRKRVERAQYLITTKSLTFSQISDEIGFRNVTYFFRIFKKITSLTPAEYARRKFSI